MSDVWQQVKGLTVEQLVERSVASGASSMTIFGGYPPHGRRFMLSLAIETENGRSSVDLLIQFHRELERLAPWVRRPEEDQ